MEGRRAGIPPPRLLQSLQKGGRGMLQLLLLHVVGHHIGEHAIWPVINGRACLFAGAYVVSHFHHQIWRGELGAISFELPRVCEPGVSHCAEPRGRLLRQAAGHLRPAQQRTRLAEHNETPLGACSKRPPGGLKK